MQPQYISLKATFMVPTTHQNKVKELLTKPTKENKQVNSNKQLATKPTKSNKQNNEAH